MTDQTLAILLYHTVRGHDCISARINHRINHLARTFQTRHQPEITGVIHGDNNLILVEIDSALAVHQFSLICLFGAHEELILLDY